MSTENGMLELDYAGFDKDLKRQIAHRSVALVINPTDHHLSGSNYKLCLVGIRLETAKDVLSSEPWNIRMPRLPKNASMVQCSSPDGMFEVEITTSY